MNRSEQLEEALRKCVYELEQYCDGGCLRDEVLDQARNALAEPPRNCDVGTAEEQAERFHNFCISNSGSIDGTCDPKCPCMASPDKCHCLCKWAQMPYEEGGEA